MSLVLTAALAVIGIVVYRVYAFLSWCRKIDAALASVPAVGRPHWLWGNLPQIRRAGGLQQLRTITFNALGVDSIKAYLGPMPILITRDPEMFKYVHANQTGSATPFVRIKTPLLNTVAGDNSVVTLDGAPWAFHRKNLQQLFRHQNLTDIYGNIVEHADRLTKLWSNACMQNPVTQTAEILVDEDMKELSIGIIANVNFSADIGALTGMKPFPMADRFQNIADCLERLMPLPPFIQMFPLLPARIRLDRCMKEADAEMLRAIESRRKKDTQSGKHEDVLDLLLNPDLNPPYSSTAIRDNCFTLYWAGQETSAMFLTWACYFLALYPDIQKRVYADLQQLPERFSSEDLNRCKYLANFLNEVLRLRAISPTTVKSSSTDACRFNELQMPKGMWIIFSIYDMHRHPKHWTDPLTFNPDRWESLSPNYDAYAPFTKGEKMCLGMRLAQLEGKAIIANVVRNFELDLCPGHDYAEKRLYLVRVQHGMKLRVRRREDPQ
ncbi:Cytochrome P450 [Plasmodiophora brassicae]